MSPYTEALKTMRLNPDVYTYDSHERQTDRGQHTEGLKH